MGDLATLRRKISFLTRGRGENACQRTDQTEIPEASGDTPNVDLFWCNQFWRNFVYS